jgi:hypothetical protein
MAQNHSARAHLLMEAQNSINRETKIMVKVIEDRIEILVTLIRQTFDVSSMDEIFAHPEIDDILKAMIQRSLDELREWKQSRYDLNEQVNQLINETLMEERRK